MDTAICKLRIQPTEPHPVYLSEGFPSRGIRYLGAMREGPGNPRFVALSSSHRRRRAQKMSKNMFPENVQNPFPLTRDT